MVSRAACATAMAGIGLAASATYAAPAAVDRYYSKTLNACMDAAGGSTLPMRGCIGAEHVCWDKVLNEAYQARMDGRYGTEKIKLRDAERAWLRATARKCDHAGDDEAGGSLQGVEIDQCYLDETIRRAIYLRGLP